MQLRESHGWPEKMPKAGVLKVGSQEDWRLFIYICNILRRTSLWITKAYEYTSSEPLTLHIEQVNVINAMSVGSGPSGTAAAVTTMMSTRLQVHGLVIGPH